MVRTNVHATVEIKPVRGKTLDAGIEREVLTSMRLRMFDEPIEKRGTESPRAVGFVRNQVVDIECAAGEQKIENSKSRHGADHAIQFEIGELISFFLLPKNACGEIDRLDVRPEFTHDR